VRNAANILKAPTCREEPLDTPLIRHRRPSLDSRFCVPTRNDGFHVLTSWCQIGLKLSDLLKGRGAHRSWKLHFVAVRYEIAFQQHLAGACAAVALDDHESSVLSEDDQFLAGHSTV